MRLWPFLKLAIPLGTLAGLLLSYSIQRWTRTIEPAFAVERPPPPSLRALAPPQRGHVCAGRLVAGAEETPVSEALVWLRSGNEGSFAWTDAEGRFRFETLGPGPWPTKVVAAGYEPLELTLAEDANLHTLKLGKAYGPPPVLPRLPRATITGQLELAGAPDLDASDFEVVLVPEHALEIDAALPRRARCDAKGAFRFDELLAARYAVRVLPAWAHGGSWPDLLLGVDGTPQREFTHSAETPHALSLALSLGTIEGTLQETIALGPGGEPIAPHDEAVEGAFVELEERASAHVWPALTTDASGHFAFRALPPGTYTLAVRAGAARQEQTIQLGANEKRALALRFAAAATPR